MTAVVHLRRPATPHRGDQYLVRAVCVGRYIARVGQIAPCSWRGHVVREYGGNTIPPCPGCGGWTEAVR